MPSAAQKSAIASSGSIAPLLAEPALAQIATGWKPSARSRATALARASTSMRNRSSVGIQADALPADSRDQRGALEGAVALVAHVHGGAFRMAGGFPRGHQGFHAGRRTSARQQAAGGLRVADPVPDPVDHDQFRSDSCRWDTSQVQELMWNPAARKSASTPGQVGDDGMKPKKRGWSSRAAYGSNVTDGLFEHFPGGTSVFPAAASGTVLPGPGGTLHPHAPPCPMPSIRSTSSCVARSANSTMASLLIRRLPFASAFDTAPPSPRSSPMRS